MTDQNNKDKTPLADRIRPENLGDFLGQNKVVGKGTLLRKIINSGKPKPMIFWGPPGSGKTTLAQIIANKTNSSFKEISAVSSGLKTLRKIIEQANINKENGRTTILFIDEIHRWNKTQQDALLPHVEKGTIVLIGATTENPSFEVRNALLSRLHVIQLKPLKPKHIEKIINKALLDKDKGLGKKDIKINEKLIKTIAEMSDGDARVALNVLEYIVESKDNNKKIKITKKDVREAFQKGTYLYDKDREKHYNLISALHKSMRGSDPNASLYYLARMLEAGEDPLYIARRIIRFASEDIGLKNSRALEQAIASYKAAHFIGMPECKLALAQAVVYMAKCKKSNKLYTAYQKASQDVKKYGSLEVPLHIRNAPTDLMKDFGYGKNYKYSPDYDYKEDQEYLPKKLRNKKYL